MLCRIFLLSLCGFSCQDFKWGKRFDVFESLVTTCRDGRGGREGRSDSAATVSRYVRTDGRPSPSPAIAIVGPGGDCYRRTDARSSPSPITKQLILKVSIVALS